jgi:uncharacterized alkaline shock family protein YloU
MSTQQTRSSPQSSTPAVREDPSSGAGGGGLLTSKGTTSISDSVVSKIAEMAAREVRGVHQLSGGVGGALRRLTPGMEERGSGADVEVGRREAIVDLNLVVDYGVSIPQVSQAVRENVIDRIEYMSGLQVKEVNIDVSDLFFVEEERLRTQQREREGGSRVE